MRYISDNPPRMPIRHDVEVTRRKFGFYRARCEFSLRPDSPYRSLFSPYGGLCIAWARSEDRAVERVKEKVIEIKKLDREHLRKRQEHTSYRKIET